MPDPIAAPAQGTGEPAPVVHPTADTLDLSKFFGPPIDGTVTGPSPGSVKTPAPQVEPVVEKPAEAVKAEPAQTPEPIKEVESEIAAALREMREERSAREQVKQEAQTWKGKYEELQAQYEALTKAPSFEDDPLEYVRSRKLPKEQISEIVQLLAYDMAPERAPQDLRFKLFESKQARKEREAREQAEAREAQEAQAREQQMIQSFVRDLSVATDSFAPGAFPANEDWYGTNRTEYIRDLFNTANELAEEARARGRQADVSAEALAAHLEKKNAERLAALEARRGKRQPAVKPAETQRSAGNGGAQSTGNPASTHGLGMGGPRPPATTEEERLRRAIEAGFGGR